MVHLRILNAKKKKNCGPQVDIRQKQKGQNQFYLAWK